MASLQTNMQNPPFILSASPWWHNLPAVNATLNGISAVLLLMAFIMIKRRKPTAHATLMIAALVTSTVFLSCYLIYHYMKLREHVALTRFPAGPWHATYISILTSHTILAVVILPLIFASVFFAYTRRWRLHHKVSSVTFPLWFYVSVTGVVVYWMLYRLAPTLGH